MPHITLSLPDAILTFLTGAYAGPHAAKRLARDAGASPRTAETWLAGQSAPSGDRLVELMAAHPALEDAIARHVRDRRTIRERGREAAARARARLGEG